MLTNPQRLPIAKHWPLNSVLTPSLLIQQLDNRLFLLFEGHRQASIQKSLGI